MVKNSINQIWLGAPMSAEDKANSEYIKQQAEKCGFQYVLWTWTTLSATFPNDPLLYLMRKIDWNYPYACLLTLVANYYKWRILSLTPHDGIGVYLDMDVKLKRNAKIELPDYVLDKNVWLDHRGDSPIIVCNGPTAANVACDAAVAVLSQEFNIDRSTFVVDAIKKLHHPNPMLECQLGRAFLNNLMPAWDRLDIKSSTLPASFFTDAVKPKKKGPLFTHLKHEYYKEGFSDQEYQTRMQAFVDTELAQAKEKKPVIVVLMSSATKYDEHSKRTLDIIKAEDIRSIQRVTSFKAADGPFNVFYYFVVGTADAISHTEDNMFTSVYKDTKANRARTMWWTIRWAVDNLAPDFIFMCDDDTYIQMDRLMKYCSAKSSSIPEVYIPIDDNGSFFGGGVLLTAAAGRKIVLESRFLPKEGDTIEDTIKNEMKSIGCEIIGEFKFSTTKHQYPSKTNRLITCHGVNPFDLVDLASQF